MGITATLLLIGGMAATLGSLFLILPKQTQRKLKHFIERMDS